MEGYLALLRKQSSTRCDLTADVMFPSSRSQSNHAAIDLHRENKASQIITVSCCTVKQPHRGEFFSIGQDRAMEAANELWPCGTSRIVGAVPAFDLLCVSQIPDTSQASLDESQQVVLTCIYRVTLHSLAKHPGPMLSKLTDRSIVIQAANADRHNETWKEHEKYGVDDFLFLEPNIKTSPGSIIRISPNTLSFNTAIALKTVYGSPKANVQKTECYRTIDAGSKAFSVHSEIDTKRHAFRRRILDQALSDAALESAAELILQNVKTWLDRLATEANEGDWGLPRNMKDWCNWLNFDMMGDLTFGKNFGCVEKGEHRFIPDVVLDSTKLVYVISLA